jgi:hypothetical protein
MCALTVLCKDLCACVPYPRVMRSSVHALRDLALAVLLCIPALASIVQACASHESDCDASARASDAGQAESLLVIVAASPGERREKMLSQAGHFAGAAQPAVLAKQKADRSQSLMAPLVFAAVAAVDSPNRARSIGAELETAEQGGHLQQWIGAQADGSADSGCDERPPGVDDAEALSVAAGSDEVRPPMPLKSNAGHAFQESRCPNIVAKANATHAPGSCMAQVRKPRTKSARAQQCVEHAFACRLPTHVCP